MDSELALTHKDMLKEKRSVSTWQKHKSKKVPVFELGGTGTRNRFDIKKFT